MPSRPRKPVSYTEERIDTGTPPWEGKVSDLQVSQSSHF